jgi:uncharacterized protein with NRDE domain
LTKEPKTYIGERAVSHKWSYENWLCTCRKLKLSPYISPCTKINPKWIKDFNVRSETLKVLQENLQKTLEDTGISNYFLTRTPNAQEIRTE